MVSAVVHYGGQLEVALQPGGEAEGVVRVGDRPAVAGRPGNGQALPVQLH